MVTLNKNMKNISISDGLFNLLSIRIWRTFQSVTICVLSIFTLNKNKKNISISDNLCIYFQDGNVRCLKKTCPVQCTHPSTTDGCCPICTKCLYDNKVHEHGQLFTPGSDPCQQCQCRVREAKPVFLHDTLCSRN